MNVSIRHILRLDISYMNVLYHIKYGGTMLIKE